MQRLPPPGSLIGMGFRSYNIQPVITVTQKPREHHNNVPHHTIYARFTGKKKEKA